MPEKVLHVTNMKGFERPPVDPTPLTVWHLQAAAEKAAAKANADSDETTPAAEQE